MNSQVQQAVATLAHYAESVGGLTIADGPSDDGRAWAVFAMVGDPSDVAQVLAAVQRAIAPISEEVGRGQAAFDPNINEVARAAAATP